MATDTPQSIRPPVALGCTFAVATIVIGGLIVLAAIAFLESGANSGRLVLDPAEAYGRGSVEFVSQRNFFVVRLADGSFLALSDLDAANRANPQRRCRVAPLAATDSQLPQLLATFSSRMSPGAAGATFLFREDCNKAVYDVTGLRLDVDGVNLDRYAVTTDAQGRVTVDISERSCSRREGSQQFLPEACTSGAR